MGTSEIGDINVPCLLLAEACRFVLGQQYGQKLSSQQTTNMGDRYLISVLCL